MRMETPDPAEYSDDDTTPLAPIDDLYGGRLVISPYLEFYIVTQ